MKLILTITVSAIMLAGCADTYNKSAMPKAAASLQQEAVGCKTKWAAKEFKTFGVASLPIDCRTRLCQDHRFDEDGCV